MTDFSEFSVWEERVIEIADELDVPWRLAHGFERKIGDVDSVKQVFRRNGPPEYLELVRRREWALEEMRELRQQWESPLLEWCEDQAAPDYEGVFPPEFDQKREQVEFLMGALDPAFHAASRELWVSEKEILEIYRTHLAHASEELTQKKEKIMELKRAFPYLRLNNGLVARATGSSLYYVDDFKFTGEEVVNQKLPKQAKQETLDRDNHSCVRCACEGDLQVHHIVPLSQGGGHELENLATLCDRCHRIAHGGSEWEGREGIWGMNYEMVVYEGRQEFWEEWAN